MLVVSAGKEKLGICGKFEKLGIDDKDFLKNSANLTNFSSLEFSYEDRYRSFSSLSGLGDFSLDSINAKHPSD